MIIQNNVSEIKQFLLGQKIKKKRNVSFYILLPKKS